MALWEPVLVTIASIADLLQAGTTPLSGVHASHVALEAALSRAASPDGLSAAINGFIKSCNAIVFSHVHVPEFSLDPLFAPFREVSRASHVRPYACTDAGVCLTSTK